MPFHVLLPLCGTAGGHDHPAPSARGPGGDPGDVLGRGGEQGESASVTWKLINGLHAVRVELCKDRRNVPDEAVS